MPNTNIHAETNTSNPIQVPVRQDEPDGLVWGFFFPGGFFFFAEGVMTLHSFGSTDAKQGQTVSDDFLDGRHQIQPAPRQNRIIG